MSTFIEGVALYAVGGDIPGMGAPEERRYRSLDGADPNLVRAFLNAQTEHAMWGCVDPMPSHLSTFRTPGYPSEDIWRRVCRLGQELIDAGVFESKYDVRSTWILTEQV